MVGTCKSHRHVSKEDEVYNKVADNPAQLRLALEKRKAVGEDDSSVEDDEKHYHIPCYFEFAVRMENLPSNELTFIFLRMPFPKSRSGGRESMSSYSSFLRNK